MRLEKRILDSRGLAWKTALPAFAFQIAGLILAAWLYQDELNPDAVCVELYANGSRGGKPARQEMRRSRRLDGAVGGYIYTATVSATRPPADYTPRVVPCCADVAIPLENARILWQR